MNRETEALYNERRQIFEDIFDGRIPKRIPINVGVLTSEFATEYAGIDLMKAQYDMTLMGEAFQKVCKDFNDSDIFPVYTSRLAGGYQILEAKNFVMGSNGVIQHPEVVGMQAEDYDYLIEKPFDCLVERVLPTHYQALAGSKFQAAAAFTKYVAYSGRQFGVLGGYEAELMDQYGFYECQPAASSSAPFDFLADQLRGFREINMDIRRRGKKVLEACEALTPLLIRFGLSRGGGPYGYVGICLHMAPYLNVKHFEKYYWPSFKKLMEGLEAGGQRGLLFLENDWTPHLDKLKELPEGTIMRFEYGDPRQIKDTLGDKHIISGLYPISLLKTGTKQACVDKAKELMDILAPGGKYFFNFDKEIISLNSINVDNYHAVLKCVKENGVY